MSAIFPINLRQALHQSTAFIQPGLLGLCLATSCALIPSSANAQQSGTALPQVEVRPDDKETATSNLSGQSGAWGFTPSPSSRISGTQATSETLQTSNSAALFSRVPGGTFWNTGGVSGLPAVNGMGGAGRVQITINDMLFGMACPNDMNPALSYVNPAMIASAEVYMGTAPVSVGGDYTGAKMDVAVAPPRFIPGQVLSTSGSVSGFYRNNGNAYGFDANATVANEDTSVSYTGGWSRADDYTSGDGTKIKSTMYETQNHALSISKKLGNHLFSAQIGGQFIPTQGYPNEYMDMVENKSLFANGRYEGEFDWGLLEASIFANRVRHTMGFIEPDKTGDMPMDTRGTDLGYKIKGTVNLEEGSLLRLGNELYYSHIDDWWPPVDGSMMMGPDTFWNINDGRRLRLGTYAEWEKELDSHWTALIGVRNDTVWMNTGDVAGYNAMMYGADATAFNAQNHARTFFNMDGTGTLRYQPDEQSTYELSFARKTRAPNFYELYSWSTSAMAMNMIGWFGDGNGYVGNLDLNAESAHTVSFTAHWKDPIQDSWSLRVSPYYSYVIDYIDVDRCAVGSCLTNRPNNLTARDSFVFLQFANHDAWLFGINIDGKMDLWDSPTHGKVTFRGNLNYVQGQRTDGVNLYNIMPLNGLVALDYRFGNWTTSAELAMVTAKTQVSQVHNEVPTAAYALINLRASYVWQQFKIDLGIENLLDTEYDLPLGGANLVNYRRKNMMGGTSPIWGYSVAGPGRSYNARVTWAF
ncbi:MAG: TonB-dependent receptor [Xanthobacter sp.]